MNEEKNSAQHFVPKVRFGLLISNMLDGIFARLVRRNVRLQEHYSVYLLEENMHALRKDAKQSLHRARAFINLIPN